MGRVIRSIVRVATSVLGATPAGAILKGVSSLVGKGGIASLLSPMSLFAKLAGKVLGGLGGMGLGGLAKPPFKPGHCAFPYPRPGVPSQGGTPWGGGSTGGAAGGGALGQAQNKFDNAMNQLTSGKKLDQQTMIKLQQQIQEANRMFEMINNIQKAIHDSLKSMIRNIQA